MRSLRAQLEQQDRDETHRRLGEEANVARQMQPQGQEMAQDMQQQPQMQQEQDLVMEVVGLLDQMKAEGASAEQVQQVISSIKYPRILDGLKQVQMQRQAKAQGMMQQGGIPQQGQLIAQMPQQPMQMPQEQGNTLTNYAQQLAIS